MKDPVAEAIIRTLETPCEAVNIIEPANVVDGLYFIGRAIHRLAEAVEKATSSESATERKP
jgi:hypothetical protein